VQRIVILGGGFAGATCAQRLEGVPGLVAAVPSITAPRSSWACTAKPWKWPRR